MSGSETKIRYGPEDHNQVEYCLRSEANSPEKGEKKGYDIAEGIKMADCVFKKLLDPWLESWIAYVSESEIWGGWEPVLVQLAVISIASTFSNPDPVIVP